MQALRTRLNFLTGCFVAAFPIIASAWNPYPDLVNPQNPPPVSYNTRPIEARAYSVPTPPAALQPPIYQTPVYQPAPSAVSYAPSPPAVTYAPPPIAYQPAPAVAANPYTPATTVAPAPTYTLPPPRQSYAGAPAVSLKDESSLGLEAFYDNYREPTVTVDSHAYYGSLTGSYTHFVEGPWFVAADGRISYGRDHYHSSDGDASGIPQWEFEPRLRAGYAYAMAHSRLDYYTGLGLRYYRDVGNGKVTSLGAGLYDRNIFQLYIPVGATYRFATASWSFKPNVEYDRLFFGNVSTHLAEVNSTLYDNIQNRQTSGYGLRGELMMAMADSPDLEFGPFFRYWDIQDSSVTIDSHGAGWIEPRNKRLQIGAALRMVF